MLAGELNPVLQSAADHYVHLRSIGRASCFVLLTVLCIITLLFVRSRIKPALRAINQVEKVFFRVLVACSTLVIFTTLGIVLSVLYEAVRFFTDIPITDFLFGLDWSPQMAIREDQIGSSGAFGAVPVFTGTLLVSAIAMFVAAPVGLMSAIYLSEYANKSSEPLPNLCWKFLPVFRPWFMVFFYYHKMLLDIKSINNTAESYIYTSINIFLFSLPNNNFSFCVRL